CAGSSTAARNGAGGRFTSLDGGSCTSCTVDGLTGGVRPFTGADKFNFAPLNYLQRPDTRYTFGAMGHYEVSKMADIYGSLMFMDDETISQVAPSGAFYGTPFQTNCDNPELTAQEVGAFCTSAGLAPTDKADLFIGRRNVEGGDRLNDLRHTSYRMVVGSKGDLGGGWAYDTFAQYGVTVFQEEFRNDVSIARINRALDVDPATGECESVVDGTDPNCVPWNIFVPNGVTKAAAAYLGVPGFEEGSTQEWVAGASVTGDLSAWGIQSPWAKSPVGVALGTEYRQEKLDFRTDEEFSSGDLAGQGGPVIGTHGGYNVSEGYGEIRVPIAENMPFFEDLSANAGYRYSSYNTAGAATSYKYGAEWQPIDDFRIRGSFQRAVRAPNVVELFAAQSLGLFGGSDPCAGAAPVFTAAQCAHTGVTAAEYGHVLQCVSGQCAGFFGGNPDLKPEQSDTREIGVVFTPTFLEGFTATVDYFDIKLNGEIGVIPQSLSLGNCATTGNPLFCNLIHRSTAGGAGQGDIFGTGPTAGFVTSTNVNTGSVQTSGVDVEANYTADLNDWGMGQNGSLSFNLLGTYTKSLDVQPVPGDHVYDCAGLFGVTCGTPIPKWRHKLRVTWTTPWDVDLSASWRYMSSVKLDANTNDPTLAGQGPCGGPCGDLSDAKINSFSYIDLAADWTVRQGVSLHAGVSNVFDKDPPELDSNSLGVSAPPFGNGNTFPQVYDSLGRLIFVGATIKY
ncbi:MAG TPA: TonB-dependent receptor, partial [Rhizomicrobium sp.]